MIAIRGERAGDRQRIHAVHVAAFGRPAEAQLVEALRREAPPRLSLVAEVEGAVAGHVVFSPVRIEGAAGAPPVGGLAPLGVLPAYQGRGVGSALVREGLRRCPALGWQAVFVLGDPSYYARFGFALAAPRGLHHRGPGFDAAFQVIELSEGALAGCAGQVRYGPAFDGLDG